MHIDDEMTDAEYEEHRRKFEEAYQEELEKKAAEYEKQFGPAEELNEEKEEKILKEIQIEMTVHPERESQMALVYWADAFRDDFHFNED